MTTERLNFRAFGPLQVFRGGSSIAAGGRVERAVLSALLLSPGQPASVGTLVELVWTPSSTPENPVHAIQTQIMRLRRHLGQDAVATDNGGYHLCAEPDDIDTHVFETFVRHGDEFFQTSEYAAAAEGYGMALAISSSSSAYDDLGGTIAGRAEQHRLSELRLEVEERAAAIEVLLHTSSSGSAEKLAMLQPLREARWLILIHAQAMAGRQADALRSYRSSVAALADVGLSPGRRLRDLEGKVLRQDSTLHDRTSLGELLQSLA